MAVTTIQWADYTFNSWIGCTHVHAGCKNCYAEADMDKRRGRVAWGPNGTRSRTSEDYWKQPLKWDRAAKASGERRRVFCASLADVFEDWQGPIVDARGEGLQVDGLGAIRRLSENATGRPWLPLTMDRLRRDLFSLIDATPSLDWLLLTKRPENVRRMWNAVDDRPAGNLQKHRKNCWLLTSVSDQPTADTMIPHLLACRDLVPVLGLSCEPLLGPVDLGLDEMFVDLDNGQQSPGIDWVIVGGESGPGARPMDLRWARGIVEQCKAAGVVCFVKQLGNNPKITYRELCMIRPNTPAVDCSPGTIDDFPLRDRKGGDMEEWPEALRIRQFPEVPVR